MQTNRLVFPLFLLFSFGEIHSTVFKIVKLREATKIGDKKEIGFLFTHGRIDYRSDTQEISSKNSGFACVSMKNMVKITFRIPLSSKLELSLNVDFFTSSFKAYDNFFVEHSWGVDDICFLFGSWWPSESNSNKKIEFFMNFVKHKHFIEHREIVYLLTVSEKDKLFSRLYLSKDITNPKTYSDKYPIEPSGDFSDPKGQEETKEEKAKRLKETKKKENEKFTRKLMLLFDQNGLTIIGFQQCAAKKDSEFNISLGSTSVALQGDGEFSMAFFTLEVEDWQEDLAAENFAKLGTSDVVKTEWADLKCRSNGVDFTPKFVFKKVREEDGNAFGEEEYELYPNEGYQVI